MKNLDIPYLCTIIGNLSGVPIRLYEGEDRIFYHALVNLPKDPVELYRDDIWKITDHVSFVNWHSSWMSHRRKQTIF